MQCPTLLRCLFAGCCLLLTMPVHAADLKVLSNFPGGSAKVEQIDQKARLVQLVPASAPERGWVCWWYFKIEGIEPGETITVDVGGQGFASPDRAMFSLDNKEWKHTAPGERQKNRTVYQQKIDGREVWFAWGPPYLLQHANELVNKAVKTSPHATAFELTKSKEGRAVPGLKVAQAGVKDEERLTIWIQARQHAWESGSSWVCQGFVDWLLSNEPEAEALRKKALVIVIPIMDVDNVEIGAGGKNQKPHDHNRDWYDQSVWPEVQAAMRYITEANKAGRFDLFVDLHNPGPGDRQPFFFVPPPELLTPHRRRNLESFLLAVRREITGPLKLADKPRETGANYDVNWQRISKNWVVRIGLDQVLGVCLETSWNTPQSTPANYQRVGKELGLAIERYFRDPTRPVKQ